MIGYGDSGTTHDFFAYNSAGSVWNGAAYVTWADGDYDDYRITATEVGTSGRFTGTAPTGAVRYELRERAATLALSFVVWTDDDVQDEVKKIHRAAAAVTAGAPQQRHLENAGGDTLQTVYEVHDGDVA